MMDLPIEMLTETPKFRTIVSFITFSQRVVSYLPYRRSITPGLWDFRIISVMPQADEFHDGIG